MSYNYTPTSKYQKHHLALKLHLFLDYSRAQNLKQKRNLLLLFQEHVTFCDKFWTAEPSRNNSSATVRNFAVPIQITAQ